MSVYSSPGASRLPIPIRSKRPSPTRNTPACGVSWPERHQNTRQYRVGEVAPGHAIRLIPGPTNVRKYQLHDPGVISAPSQSALPRPLRGLGSASPSTESNPPNLELRINDPARRTPQSAVGRQSGSHSSIQHSLQNTPQASRTSSGPVTTPVTAPPLDKTPSMSSRQSTASLSTFSSTSTHSSASSMARARAAEIERIRMRRYEDGKAGFCAPYLVPTDGPQMTLAWHRDPESVENDPAEELWKLLENKLGRSLRGTMKDRGRWVAEPEPESQAMETAGSEFTVSAYESMDDEVLFDMTAPLIPSISSTAATPVNTPCIRRETLQRKRHVRKKDAMSREGSSSGDSIPSSMADTSMFRLDSHIVSALSALQGIFDSPDLDKALGLCDYEEDAAEEEGLGLGMHLRLSSVYTLRSQQRESNPFTVKDLDTGLTRPLSIRYHS